MTSEIRKALLRTSLIITSLICFGTLGYTLLDNSWSIIDAFYMTIISITTVGYGEVHHLSDSQRIFTSILIIVGIGTAATALTNIGTILLESRLDRLLGKRKMDKRIRLLKDHYIICGYNEISAAITSELDRASIEFVIIDNLEDSILNAQTRGYLTLKGDSAGDTVLITAGIKKARGIVICSDEFVKNLVVSMAARELNPNIYIICQGSNPEFEERLRRAGANEVSYPLKRGGQHIAKHIVEQSGDSINREFEYTDTEILGYRLRSYTYYSSAKDHHEFLSDVINRTGASKVLALKTLDGKEIDNPDSNRILLNGDKLVLLTKGNQHEVINDETEIDWNDDLSVGIPSIDEEHKMLFFLITKINKAISCSAPRSEIADILDNLIDYTERHFSHEERLFKEYNYPKSIEHIQEHRELTAQVRALNRDRNSILPSNLNDFLINWIQSHIVKCDMEYVEFLREFNID